MSDDIISELTKKMLSYFRTKDKNKRNARTRITKKQKAALADDGGYAKLQQAKKDAAKKKKMLAQRGKSPGALGGKTDVKQAKMSMPKKRPQSITALSIIKKDSNIKTDKTPKKKVIVTKEQLRKSGLSLSLLLRKVALHLKRVVLKLWLIALKNLMYLLIKIKRQE